MYYQWIIDNSLVFKYEEEPASPTCIISSPIEFIITFKDV